VGVGGIAQAGQVKPGTRGSYWPRSLRGRVAEITRRRSEIQAIRFAHGEDDVQQQRHAACYGTASRAREADVSHPRAEADARAATPLGSPTAASFKRCSRAHLHPVSSNTGSGGNTMARMVITIASMMPGIFNRRCSRLCAGWTPSSQAVGGACARWPMRVVCARWRPRRGDKTHGCDWLVPRRGAGRRSVLRLVIGARKARLLPASPALTMARSDRRLVIGA